MNFLEKLNVELDAVVENILKENNITVVLNSEIHRPHDLSHGDLTSSVALKLTKAFKKSPMQIGEIIKEKCAGSAILSKYIQSIEIVLPGFINFTLHPEVKYEIIKEIMDSGEYFGCVGKKNEKVLLEFVSANPTGPLHIGHARQAVLGESICNLLKTQGYEVTKEFFYNDAGNQIETLTQSVKMRLDGFSPGDACWPLDGNFYNGEYIADIADAYLRKETVIFDNANESVFVQSSGDISNLKNIKNFAVAYLRKEQNSDLESIGVKFDNFYLESDLYKNGDVEKAVSGLINSGHTKELDGALWLNSTAFGDDKDRVMRKSGGGYTYFVPDVAYHVKKWNRGFTKAINIQGSDHHGTVARVRAGLQALDIGIPKNYPSYLLHTMVNVVKDGKQVKLSKRAGSYVTLSDIVEWTSADAVKFFLLSKKASTEDTFDVDLAVKDNNENPVFYVQYAHARIKTILARWSEEGGDFSALFDASGLKGLSFKELQSPLELKLLSMLEKYPFILAEAAKEMAPHGVVLYLRDLASMYHQYYGQERVFVDDKNIKDVRLVFSCAIAQVLANGLGVLGVSAPNSMLSKEKEMSLSVKP